MLPPLSANHVICTAAGFHGIPEGTRLTMRVIRVETACEQTIGPRTTRVLHREAVIALTTPDGTRHHFHTRPEDAAQAAFTTAGPAPNPFRPDRVQPVVHHHPIDPFVKHFEVPAQSDILDLLDAIVTAAAAESTA